MRNKKGLSLLAILVVGVLIIIAAGGIYWGVTQTQLAEGDETDPTACGDSTGTITLNNYSAIAGGTQPGVVTYTGSIDDGIFATTITSASTTFPIGAKVEVHASATDYIDNVFTVDAIPCGGAVLDVPLYYSTSDNPGIRVKNDDGDFMDDLSAGGATNQTYVEVGETIQLEVEFSGTSLEASGDGIWVIEFEADSDTSITSVTLDGQTTKPKPTVHSLQNAGSELAVFEVSDVVGGVKTTKLLEITLAGSGVINGSVLTDWYSKQWFIDDDKTIAYGIEDADGTAKYENTLDYDFYIMENSTM